MLPAGGWAFEPSVPHCCRLCRSTVEATCPAARAVQQVDYSGQALLGHKQTSRNFLNCLSQAVQESCLTFRFHVFSCIWFQSGHDLPFLLGPCLRAVRRRLLELVAARGWEEVYLQSGAQGVKDIVQKGTRSSAQEGSLMLGAGVGSVWEHGGSRGQHRGSRLPEVR